MNYKEIQRKKQVELLTSNNDLFDGALGGGTMFDTKKNKWVEYPFIIQHDHSDCNLYRPIRKYALEYFERYSIAWWNQSVDRYFPTGHLLSSQIHCLNHLFNIAKDSEAVLKIIQPIGDKIGVHFDEVLPSFIDNHEHWMKHNRKYILNSYLSFEFVYHNIHYLNESFDKRGAKCTSVDCFVYAKAGNDFWFIPIEWKYTEDYLTQTEVFDYQRYEKFVTPQSRLKCWSPQFELDPYFELGRQTLFMEQIINNPINYTTNDFQPQERELKVNNFLHLVVAPRDNDSFRKHAEKFRQCLKNDYQQLFQIVDPQDFLASLKGQTKYEPLLSYLSKRYWN